MFYSLVYVVRLRVTDFCWSATDTSVSPCLWIGTSLGGVISVTLTLPETNDDRVLCLQSVLAVASGEFIVTYDIVTL